MECKQNNQGFSEKKNQTPERGQDEKISDTRGKDFYWSPTRQSLVGDQKSFPWVSEIFRLALLPMLDPLYLY